MASLIKTKNNIMIAPASDPISEAELRLCAHTVALLGHDEKDDIHTSLGWVIRNRVTRNSMLMNDPRKISDACEAVLREALDKSDRIRAEENLSEIDWSSVRAANYLVWKGKVMDQTHGATSCHRHDKNPAWSRQRTPTALLGAFLFFR